MAKSERRSFRMNPKLLFDVIRKQAGTLSKAVFEGVMNAADAGAKSCYIEICPTRVSIRDDGKGFRNRKEIEDWFETFGTPHDDSEGKIYGTFRMGRGQLFSFGRNHWRSGEFMMKVDIKNEGLDYDLSVTKTLAQGCNIEITLYEELLPSAVLEFQRDIKRLCRYIEVAGTKVYVEGVRVSRHPDEEKWDHITDDGWVRLQSARLGLEIYNLGGFVHEQPTDRFATGGVVVSKRRLDVNFARNDIMSTCRVWKNLRSLVQSKTDEKLKRKSVLTEHERQCLVDRLLAGELDDRTIQNAKLVTDVNGVHWSIMSVGYSSHRFSRMLTSAPDGDRLGDTMHQQRAAFVVGSVTLDRFGVQDIAGLVAALLPVCPVNYLVHYAVAEFSEITKGVDREHIVLAADQCTPTQLLWRDIIKKLEGRISAARVNKCYEDWHPSLDLKIMLGRSNSAMAWTDGSTYICFNVDKLAKIVSYEALLQLVPILVHEISHDSASLSGHAHSPEFYQRFHELMRPAMLAASSMRTGLADIMTLAGRKPNKWVVRGMDVDVITEKAAEVAAAAMSEAVKQLPVAKKAKAVQKQRD